MGGVCWVFPRVVLLMVTSGKFVYRYGGPFMAAPGAAGGGLTTGGPPRSERRAIIRRFHDSLFAGHLGISRTVLHLQTRVYWPGLRQDVRTYVASCTVCIARKSPCPRRAPMGHVAVGRRWERVAMDLLDMSKYFGEGESLCVSNGELFLSVDGSLSTS